MIRILAVLIIGFQLTLAYHSAIANSARGALMKPASAHQEVKAVSQKVSFNNGDDYGSCPCLEAFKNKIPQRPQDYNAETQPDPFSWNNDKPNVCEFNYQDVKLKLALTNSKCRVLQSHNHSFTWQTLKEESIFNNHEYHDCLNYIKNEC